VASLSQGRTAAAQCGLFTHKSVPVIFEPPCIILIAVTLFWDFYLIASVLLFITFFQRIYSYIPERNLL